LSKERLKKAKDKWGLVAHLFKEVEKEVSEEKAIEIARRAFIADVSERIRRELEDLEGKERFNAWMTRRVRMQKNAGADLDYEVLEATPKRFCVKITRCSTEEVLRELGFIRLCQAYCDSDFETAKSIHPKVKLIRDKTIAHGDGYCNHCWVWEE